MQSENAVPSTKDSFLDVLFAYCCCGGPEDTSCADYVQIDVNWSLSDGEEEDLPKERTVHDIFGHTLEAAAADPIFAKWLVEINSRADYVTCRTNAEVEKYRRDYAAFRARSYEVYADDEESA